VNNFGETRREAVFLFAISAFGPKRTSLVAPQMSAFGREADIRGMIRAAQIAGSESIFCQPPRREMSCRASVARHY
jgi:hypothetical protein